MEDHSVFYSRNLRPYENWCRRLHFFNLPEQTLIKNLENLLTYSEETPEDRRAEYLKRCSEFSMKFYLGFMTVKPLSGCPVGRTVLRPYKRQGTDGRTRIFPCIREYTVHISGVSLSVNGLAFQQQDRGVSACATTALWSSLQMVKSHEDVASSTPALITTLASRYTLPFGRPMPSEGLSIEQMCLAVQAIGMSPSLIKAEDPKSTLGGIFSATISGFAPVLILKALTTSPTYHAVTVTGSKLNPQIPSRFQIGLSGSMVNEEAARCEALYIHDDRYGPYLRATLSSASNHLELTIDPERDGKRAEHWIVTHLLVPVHPKIRLSFSSLRRIAIEVCLEINAIGNSAASPLSKGEKITVAYKIEKGSKYAEGIVLNENNVDLNRLSKFYENLVLPRYLGIIKVTASWLGEIDILVDTTSTVSNLDFVGLISRNKTQNSEFLLKELSHLCQCPFID